MTDLNEAEFRRAAEGSRPILVDFWAPWCVHCRRIEPVLESLDGQLAIGKVNIDQEPELARREGIEVIPTLKLYQNGRELGHIIAPESKARLESFLRGTLGD